MKITELRADSKNIILEAKVVEKEETRDVNTRFGAAKVCNCTIEDDSGKMVLVLWDDQIEKLAQGDKIKVENAYIREWNGVMQLNTGKYGKLTVVKPDAS